MGTKVDKGTRAIGPGRQTSREQSAPEDRHPESNRPRKTDIQREIGPGRQTSREQSAPEDRHPKRNRPRKTAESQSKVKTAKRQKQKTETRDRNKRQKQETETRDRNKSHI
jgi:hypothetical protein